MKKAEEEILQKILQQIPGLTRAARANLELELRRLVVIAYQDGVTAGELQGEERRKQEQIFSNKTAEEIAEIKRKKKAGEHEEDI